MRAVIVPFVSALVFAGIAHAQTDRTRQAPPAEVDRARQEALVHLRLGEENMRAELWDKAEAEFQQAAKLDPRLELAHYGLGRVYMATKRYPAAVAAYLKCRDVALEVRSQQAAGQLENEQRVVDQLQQLETERQLITSGRYAIRDPTGALAFLDSVIRDMRDKRYSQPTSTPEAPAYISLALGSAYFRSGAMADAEREYGQALKTNPKLGEAHNNLAVVYMLTDRLDQAEQELKLAEKNGFKVNPQLKEDVKAKRKGKS